MTKILHIVRNAVTHDSRVLKVTVTIIEQFTEKKLCDGSDQESAFAEYGTAHEE